MMTLDKVERIAGFVNNRPPCNEINFQQMADNLQSILKEWKNEMKDHLVLLEKTKENKNTIEYKRRVVSILDNGKLAWLE